MPVCTCPPRALPLQLERALASARAHSAPLRSGREPRDLEPPSIKGAATYGGCPPPGRAGAEQTAAAVFNTERATQTAPQSELLISALHLCLLDRGPKFYTHPLLHKDSYSHPFPPRHGYIHTAPSPPTHGPSVPVPIRCSMQRQLYLFAWLGSSLLPFLSPRPRRLPCLQLSSANAVQASPCGKSQLGTSWISALPSVCLQPRLASSECSRSSQPTLIHTARGQGKARSPESGSGACTPLPMMSGIVRTPRRGVSWEVGRGGTQRSRIQTNANPSSSDTRE